MAADAQNAGRVRRGVTGAGLRADRYDRERMIEQAVHAWNHDTMRTCADVRDAARAGYMQVTVSSVTVDALPGILFCQASDCFSACFPGLKRQLRCLSWLCLSVLFP